MRIRWLLGLLFALAVTCLMCLPFVVSREEAPAEAAAPPVQRETAMVAEAQPPAPSPRPCRERQAAVPVWTGTFAARPVADANGVPILESSYVRSNYQAFRLTGWG